MTDLRASDFEIYEDGGKQTINNCAYVTVEPGVEEQAEEGSSTIRHAERPRRQTERRTMALIVDDLEGRRLLSPPPQQGGARRGDRAVSLTLQIVGSWTLYLQKRHSAACPPDLTDEHMLDCWADLWARILDQQAAACPAPGGVIS